MNPEAEFRLAADAYRSGNYPAALLVCERLLVNAVPGTEVAAVLNLKALCLAGQGLLFAAADCIDQALSAEPGNAMLWHHCARIQLALMHTWKAGEASKKACDLAPRNLVYRYQLARSYLLADDTLKAGELARQCVDEDPGLHDAWILLSELAEDRGDRDAAIACLQEVVRRDTRHARAWAALSALDADAVMGDSIQPALEQIAVEARSAEDAATALFALADRSRTLGHFQAAFAQYREANERLARLRHFNIEEWELQVETTIRDSRAWLESAAFASPAGDRKWGENLVFIVGMPRSGTSLCEQVLCSHSRIFGAGELATMEYITRALMHDSCDPFGADAHWLNPMRREYLASLPPSMGQYERVSDKSPRNFERLGLVFRLFPGARVLWCQRHPLDTIISCYFQDFQDGQRFSNSLDHIARMYVGHVRLMRHWMNWFAGSIEVIEYSTLVRNLEATARGMAKFVGLDYEAEMCQPHRNPRLTLTASSQQVRQPVYTGSIDNWRHYREELREVASLLQEHGLLDSECRSIMATTAEPGGN